MDPFTNERNVRVKKESAFGFFSHAIRRYLPGMDDQNI
jgi:hypothetical protein